MPSTGSWGDSRARWTSESPTSERETAMNDSLVVVVDSENTKDEVLWVVQPSLRFDLGNTTYADRWSTRPNITSFSP